MHCLRNKWYPNSGVTHPVSRMHYRAVADICLRFTYTIAVPFDEDVQAWINYMRIMAVRCMDRATLTWHFRIFKGTLFCHPPPITHKNEWSHDRSLAMVVATWFEIRNPQNMRWSPQNVY
ncbi:hypothetical protein M422DRAFT_39921 [Sphaerobolus stellatus SS14]|uniref:Uncharacterized protein n=1 Tax=Sphaerobolus stellatus (strain SS14) TaxID=990650 RepID=A0A0C9T1W9_SPHS4|nr:hypothetical protein M422DRAFT_39921 [Sphaerobolus stellatus SS14]